MDMESNPWYLLQSKDIYEEAEILRHGVYFVRIEEHIAGVDLEVGILGFDALAR